ncbi:hypothetical protein ACJJTC_002593 [Scirpophaga incertulas]
MASVTIHGDSKKSRFNKIKKSLQSVVKNALGLSKSDGGNDLHIRLKAKLKGERLQALTLVESQERAETEMLLNELDLTKELNSLKRKRSSRGIVMKTLKMFATKNAKSKINTGTLQQKLVKSTQVAYHLRCSSTPNTISPRTQMKNSEITPKCKNSIIEPTAKIVARDPQRDRQVISVNSLPLRNISKNNLGYITAKDKLKFNCNNSKCNRIFNSAFYPTLGNSTASDTSNKENHVLQNKQLIVQ